MKHTLRSFIGTSCIDEQVFNNKSDAVQAAKDYMKADTIYKHETIYEIEDEDGNIETLKHI